MSLLYAAPAVTGTAENPKAVGAVVRAVAVCLRTDADVAPEESECGPRGGGVGYRELLTDDVAMERVRTEDV